MIIEFNFYMNGSSMFKGVKLEDAIKAGFDKIDDWMDLSYNVEGLSKDEKVAVIDILDELDRADKLMDAFTWDEDSLTCEFEDESIDDVTIKYSIPLKVKREYIEKALAQ